LFEKRSMTKILVVDDEVQLIKMVQMRLETHGYEVISANDGEEGLKKAKSENPDLILLDVVMPKMDGYQVCRLLKTDALYTNIPIILFTGKAQDDFEEIGDKVGADAFVTKPFDSKVLLGKVEELLKRS